MTVEESRIASSGADAAKVLNGHLEAALGECSRNGSRSCGRRTLEQPSHSKLHGHSGIAVEALPSKHRRRRRRCNTRVAQPAAMARGRSECGAPNAVRSGSEANTSLPRQRHAGMRPAGHQSTSIGPWLGHRAAAASFTGDPSAACDVRSRGTLPRFGKAQTAVSVSPSGYCTVSTGMLARTATEAGESCKSGP